MQSVTLVMIAVHAYEKFQWSSQIRPADHRSHPRAPTTGNRLVLYTSDRGSKITEHPTPPAGVLWVAMDARRGLCPMLEVGGSRSAEWGVGI